MSEGDGRVLAVCVGPGGIPKQPVEEAAVGELGLAGDGHRYERHGGRNRALCLFAIEDYEYLAGEGVEARAPGAFGENVLTEGLDYGALRAGDRLAVGEVLLEIFDVRAPCATLKAVDARFPRLMLGHSGFVCRVLRGGTLRAGQSIERVGAP